MALFHAPGERRRLRELPLPSDMDRLLAIAAGVAPGALADAAVRFNIAEASVLEASRFYVREVLLHSQADAYRALGVLPNAPAAQIKQHYRLLQRWLHPDRPDQDEDSVLVTRVNRAWNSLRNPQRRAAYDRACLRAGTDERRVTGDAVAFWRPQAEVRPVAHWRPVRVMAVTGTCLLLAWLAVLVARDAQRPPPIGLDLSGKSGQAALPSMMDDVDVAASPKMPSPPVLPASSERVKLLPPPKPKWASLSALPDVQPPTAVTASSVSLSLETKSGQLHAVQPLSLAPHLSSPGEQKLAALVVGQQGKTPPSADRVQRALRIGSQLQAFFLDTSRASPPIWNSPVIQNAAGRLRGELVAFGRISMADPQWQIDKEKASYTSQVVSANGSGGVIRVGMIWREQRWLVDEVSMSDGQ